MSTILCMASKIRHGKPMNWNGSLSRISEILQRKAHSWFKSLERPLRCPFQVFWMNFLSLIAYQPWKLDFWRGFEYSSIRVHTFDICDLYKAKISSTNIPKGHMLHHLSHTIELMGEMVPLSTAFFWDSSLNQLSQCPTAFIAKVLWTFC